MTMTITKKLCPKCQNELPITLFVGSVCHECKVSHLQSVELAGAKKRMSDDQREMLKQQADEIKYEEEQRKIEEAKLLDRKAAARKEQAERELSRRRLLPFVQRFNPEYMPGWVHIDICSKLEKFSQDVIDKKSPRLMLFLPPRHGKNIAHSTPVLTANRGWVTHGDLVPGDQVFHPSGKPVDVLALSDEAVDDYVVTFTNGEKIRCHANHEWTVYSRADKQEKTVETKWFLENTNRGTPRSLTAGNRFQFQVPKTNALEFDSADLPMHPYVLGAWLGDGTKNSGCITHDKKDQPVIDKITRCGYEVSSWTVHKQTGVYTTRFSGPRPNVAGRMFKELKELNVLNNKHIPEVFLRASLKDRLELLAGLIDTDGHTDKNSRMRFTTADKPLANGVLDLCTTLGFKPYIEEIQPKLSTSCIQGTKPYFVVGFNPTMVIPVALSRKRITRFPTERRVSIEKVEYLPNGEKGHCIQVDSPDGLYLVGKKLVATHNSELASKTFPAWHLGRMPKHEVIASSYASDLAMDFSRKVRGILADPDYGRIFKTRLDKKSQSAERWNTDANGGYVAAGVGGAITGRGAHIGIIDDPIKNREDAESATNRQKIKDWYTSTFYTRLAPGGGVLVILTRWHDDDLAGWLIDQENEGGDKWEIVRYPAIAVSNEKYRLKGDALHPDRYPLDALERIKRAVGDRDWSALYQQNPVPDEGAYFQKDWFRYYEVEPPRERLKVYQAWDFAIGTAEHNDYTVGVTIGIDRDDKAYLLNVARGKWDALEIIEKIIDEYTAFLPQVVGFEKGQIEMALGPMLRKRMRERKTFFAYEELKTGRRDKSARARPLQGRMQQGMVLLPKNAEFTNEIRNEMLRFPAGTHDDQVDAFSWAFQMLDQFIVTHDPKPKKKKSWKDRLNKYVTNSTKRRSYMRA
ncbi:chaperone and heat shock protein 70 [Alteromonas mediterranea DE]|uniref:Chaperone and heat shock protein 70 n=2 Tax=Alteromonas mediterranea TaxID=314275 RepID=F2GCA3_ALTMD|nr:chaperone and heat shock protein 70 [Alteromonas mediterranea DE]